MPARDLFLLTFFVGSLPICFLRPFYGIVMWTIVAFLNPQAFLWSIGSEFPWALVVSVATIAGVLLFGGYWKALQSRDVAIILMLWGWFAITSIASATTPLFAHHSLDTWYRLKFVSKILLMTLLMIPIVSTFARLRTLLIVVGCCFGFFVAKAFPFVIMTGGAFKIYGPARSMISDNNDLGLALNMTLPVFFFLAHTESNPWMKRLFTCLFFMSIPAIFFTYSRGALVGLVAVFVSFLVFLPLKQRLLLVPVIAAGIVVALMFAPESWKHRMDPTREDAIDLSAQSRLNAWKYCRNLAADYPITGGGFATFTPELFVRYAPAGMTVVSPHSVYFQLLAEHGYVGLAIYLLLVVSAFATAQRLIRQARARGDQIVRQYACMFQFALIGFLSSGIFLGRAYFDYFFFMIACLVILKRVAADEWAREDAEDAATEDQEENDCAASSELVLEGR